MARTLEGSDSVHHAYTHVAVYTQSLDLQIAPGPNYSRPFTGEEMKAGRDHDVPGLTESRNLGWPPTRPAACELFQLSPSAVERGT